MSCVRGWTAFLGVVALLLGPVSVARATEGLGASVPAAGPGAWAVLDAGDGFSCGVKLDGSLWCWGDNPYGQLGDGTIVDRRLAVRVGHAEDWLTVTAGEMHTCGIRAGGSLWCWGAGKIGQLGSGELADSRVPQQVPVGTWSHVSAGGQFTCGIQTDQTLWCWGDNSRAKLGNGTEGGIEASPVQISDASWLSLSTGFIASCAVAAADGSAWCWGWNYKGVLGIGKGEPLVPTQVKGDGAWASVEVGSASTCGVQTAPTPGSLWCWGSNRKGALGLGPGGGDNRRQPTHVGTDTDWSTVDAGIYFACATKTTGTLWCWGYNGYGQLGIGRRGTERAPVQVGRSAAWEQVSCGLAHTLGRRQHGPGWAWGHNLDGQLGDATTKDRNHPVRILDLTPS